MITKSLYSKVWQADTTSMLDMMDILRDEAPDEIAYEDFKHRPNLMKAELHSMKIIGIIELYAEEEHVPIIGTPLPSEAKAFWTDDKIKKLGHDLYQKGSPHGVDATRVALTTFSKDDRWFEEVIRKL